MSRKFIATLGILVVLLVSMVGTAAGQTGGEVTSSPTPEVGEETGTEYYAHPIVQLLSKYFDRVKEWETVPTATPEAEGTVDPAGSETPDPSATPVVPGEEVEVPMAEQIAQYHEEGMGFGVLVKLYAMAEASEKACAEQVEPVLDEATGAVVACVPVTADQLVESFQGGTGMGQLFKEHGKPALLGVGHVRKALEEVESQPTDEATLEPVVGEGDVVVEGALETQGNKPVKPVKTLKVKTNNGRGAKK